MSSPTAHHPTQAIISFKAFKFDIEQEVWPNETTKQSPLLSMPNELVELSTQLFFFPMEKFVERQRLLVTTTLAIKPDSHFSYLLN